MALTLQRAPAHQPYERPEPTRPWRLQTVALTAVTLSVAAVVATGGSPGWAAVRVVTVVALGVTAIVISQRGGAGVRAVTAGVAGVFGLSAGAGIGVMHIVKSDMGLEAVAGAVSLLGGLVLLVIAMILMWRAVPGWWRLLAAPVAFVTVQFGLIPLSVAVYSTNVPATHLDKATPADAGFPYREVNFTTSDGARLSGWYIPSRNGAAVAVLHGSGSTRSSVLPQAEVIAGHGYGVLLFDARGHGRSTGTAMDTGWWGDRDLTAAVSWLQGRPDVRPGKIGAVGLSMGGEEAIGAAAADSRIRAVVAEGALWRGSMDAGWLPQTLTGYIDRGELAIQTAVTGLLTSAPQPTSLRRAVAAISPRPVLLIAGSPEIRGDRYLRDASPANVQLWELPDTPHIGGLARHPAEWEGRVTAFLNSTLQPLLR
ncbi:MAG TPA: alpha/beta fold hydrolase [Acidimicrobiales bacterium]|nr:alpha/beta fold hydrolase [Acidimicrobiales bacterium]